MANGSGRVARERPNGKNAAEPRLALVTAASEDQALAIARALVAERLAACVNLVAGVRSIYRWREAIEDDREWLLLIKTTAARFAALERRVRELHSYETPEVVALPIAEGSPPYLKWLTEMVAEPAVPPRPAGARRARLARSGRNR